MSWNPNPYKLNKLEQKEQTAGLPLFDENSFWVPDWIWNGSEIKKEVYWQMKDKFSEEVFRYLNGIIKLGGKATDHEVKELLKWDLHIVSARRNDLKKLGIIESFPGDKKTGPAGVPNTIWSVNFKNLKNKINEVINNGKIKN